MARLGDCSRRDVDAGRGGGRGGRAAVSAALVVALLMVSPAGAAMSAGGVTLRRL